MLLKRTVTGSFAHEGAAVGAQGDRESGDWRLGGWEDNVTDIEVLYLVMRIISYYFIDIHAV